VAEGEAVVAEKARVAGAGGDLHLPVSQVLVDFSLGFHKNGRDSCDPVQG
jgi:hypothetical protein